MLLGFGMGGEWAAGAALVAETWPTNIAANLAFMQSSWAIGYALTPQPSSPSSCHITAGAAPSGLLPAVLAIWIRRRVREPERWTATKTTNSSAIAHIFRGRNGRHLAIVTLVNAATLFAWWGLFFWVPSYLSLPTVQGGRGLSIVQTSTWTILMQAGTFLGYVSYGFLADHLGRKWVYVGFLFMAAIVVQFYAHAASAMELLWIGPLVGFSGTGYLSGFAVITSALFPTALRGTAMGSAYNTGTILSAAAPPLIARASARPALSPAPAITPFMR